MKTSSIEEETFGAQDGCGEKMPMNVALALGGGGVKGIAHIGVIDRLESHGFHIAAIAGTSAGSMVGAAYASGHTPLEILAAISNVNAAYLYRRGPDDGPSLLGSAGLVETLSALLKGKQFSDLRIPFACSAVNIISSQEIYLSEGPVLDAVKASMAVPGILPPQQTENATLVDGGVMDPVPVQLARILAPGLPVIAVALQPGFEDWEKQEESSLIGNPQWLIPAPILQGFARLRFGQAFHIFAQSLDISMRMVTELRLKIDQPDVIIRPNVFRYGLFDKVETLDLVEAGRLATDQCLPEIRRAVSWRGKFNRLIRQLTPATPTDLARAARSDLARGKKRKQDETRPA